MVDGVNEKILSVDSSESRGGNEGRIRGVQMNDCS